MLEAFGWGALAQSSLLVSGVIVCWVTFPRRLVGFLAGYGAGAMIAAISFDLIPEAQANIPMWQFALWMLGGVGVFLLSDRMIERRYGTDGSGEAMGIVVGSVVDGVPESAILGIQIGAGLALSPSFIAAVLISNIPQAIAPSADLHSAGWGPRRLGRLWLLIVLACGVAAALGYLLTNLTPNVEGDRLAALAAGGLLAMLANSLIPFAYEKAGELAGVGTAIGFCIAVLPT
jgi:ZIP family zinc transporter